MPTSHSWKKQANLLKPNIQCASVTYSMCPPVPCQSQCITAALVILLNWVTPVWRWQMVQQNNASHFSAAQYCVTEQPSCIPSGSDPFLDTRRLFAQEYENNSGEISTKWANVTSPVCFVLERYSDESAWQMPFYVIQEWTVSLIQSGTT